MRLVAAAALVFAMVATPAMAQTTPAPETAAPAVPSGPPNPPSRCDAFPAAPAVPDASVTDRAVRDAAYTAYRAWGVAMQAVLACRRAEVNEVNARKEALTAEHNTGVEELRRVSDAFVAAAGGTAAQTPPAR